MVKVLFIDDDRLAHKTLAAILPDPYVLVSALTAADGLRLLAAEGADAVLLDIGLPDMDGMEVLRRIASSPVSAPVIMLTALSDIRLVKEALQEGAYDYIAKPYALPELLGTLRRAAANAGRAALGTGAGQSFGGMLGESGALREVRDLIRRYGATDCPVLLSGESGTGKELAARAVHEVSTRAAGPLVAVNCGAIPETLLETELFGAERGAFTDAVSRPGCFERAHGGTLFLDEIAEMPAGAQVRLLRILEQKELTRVGGVRAVPVDVRIVTATNRDLKTAVGDGSFRSDLFWRISVLPIRIPPLRDRREDVPLLCAHFAAELDGSGTEFGEDALEKLSAHAWPGNIRELRNVVQRAVLAASGGPIRARHILFD
jgi:DNA-binding NtrC family response regulator